MPKGVEVPLKKGAKGSVKEADREPLWKDRDPVQERFLRIKMKRISFIREKSAQHYPEMRESMRLYEGKSSVMDENKDKRSIETVVPIARAFVEAKTSEEVKAMNEYEYIPVKSTADSWRVGLIKDVNSHVQRVTKYKSNRHKMIRMKNAAGVSIKRKGYRKIMRWIKDRVDSDDDARGTEFKLRLVPVYDDLFEEVISPFNFAIDPNAKTLDDAMDCCHFHVENKDVFHEMYGNDPRFINVDKVRPGVKYTFNENGEYTYDEKVGQDGILVEEYFNKVLDEWVIVANGVLITPVTEEDMVDHTGTVVITTDEEGNQKPKKMFVSNPLPDDHKELPFVSYHNHAKFAVEAFSEPPPDISPDGDEVSGVTMLDTEESFWTKGDPIIIKDLIDLNTGFTRALFRNMKIAAEVIVATKPGKKFKNKHYKSGDQAVGMMGQFEVVQVGKSLIGDIVPLLDWLMAMKVLTIGIDPRNLSQEMKTKTATEAAIMRETALARLEEGIDYNEENGEVRDGILTYKLIQQYYSKPEVVRITGLETEEELDRFDEVIKDGDIPFMGKRYRLIRSSIKLREKKKKTSKGEYKFYLSREEKGISSFLARPEYIRSSEVDVTTTTTRRAGEIRSINAQQSIQLIELFIQLFELARPGPNGQSVISIDDLPDMKEELKVLMKALGRNPDSLSTKDDDDEDQKRSDDALAEVQANQRPVSDTQPSISTPPQNASDQ